MNYDKCNTRQNATTEKKYAGYLWHPRIYSNGLCNGVLCKQTRSNNNKRQVWTLQIVKTFLLIFRMILKNEFGTECSLFVLSANGWKDQNKDTSFSGQKKP